MKNTTCLFVVAVAGVGCNSIAQWESDYRLADAGSPQAESGTGGSAGQGSGGDASVEAGGDAGSACDGGAQTIGVVGEPCCNPNELACAGHAQKLVLFCSPKTGTWEALQSCSGKLLCDTTPGPNQGSCQEPATLCVGLQPGDKLCDGQKSVECGPDLLTTIEVECSFACKDGECSGGCKPGSRQCSSTTPQQCDENGEWQSEAPCPYVCAADGQCTGHCTPGSKQCAANTPQECDSSGNWVSGAPCASVCANGECVASCTNGAKQCVNAKKLQTCVSGAWQDTQDCPYLCGDGACKGVCVPGSQMCSDLVPKTCDASGAWQSGSACKYLCADGVCNGECKPGSQECSGLVPRTCGPNATWSNGAECPFVCSAGLCTGVCSPGDTKCDGLIPQTCTAAGAWENGTPCTNACTAGTCGGFCTPGTKQCNGNVLQACDAIGQWKDESVCPYVCTSGACAGVCTPGTKDCNGLIPRTCDANGQWQSGTACPYVCSAGACTGVCVPGTDACASSTSLTTCDPSGQWNAATTCSATTPSCKAAQCVAADFQGASCVGLADTCGPGANEDCCSSPLAPGGTFNRGNNASYPATVSDFRLDAFEVTVGRFRKFVAEYSQTMTPSGAGKNPNNPSDSGWNPAWNASLPATSAALITRVKCNAYYQTWTDTPGSKELRPINCIDWFVAAAFCIWDGGRLPTEAEWNHAAAGGSEQRVYPWSNPPSQNTISCSLANCSITCGDKLFKVGSLSPAGDARWGHRDMTGNVAEWVMDLFSASYPMPCTNCAASGVGSLRVMRGGHFYDEADVPDTTYRLAVSASHMEEGQGVRCARKP